MKTRNPQIRNSWRIISLLTTFICGLMLLLGLFLLTERSYAAAAWSYGDRQYRAEIIVNSGDFPRREQTAEIEMDFAQLLSDAGEGGSFDEASLAMVEVDENGVTVNTAVSFQFDNGLPQGSSAASGTLVWLLEGTTAANTNRIFHIYFDAADNFSAPPTPTNRVVLSEVPNYRGQASYRLRIFNSGGSRVGDYYYHRTGGGFASLFDTNGNDWISYYPDVDSRGKGEFRGVPNLGDVFHPGYSELSGSNQGSTTTLLDEGPLKATIQSVSFDGEYEAIWEIYPDHLRMTLVNRPDNDAYWFLYEGTPGGNYDAPGSSSDLTVRPDGTSGTASWTADLDPEWVYFDDFQTSQSLFVAQLNPTDVVTDSFRRQRDNGAVDPVGSTDNGQMVVFGFGRDGSNRLLTETDVEFVLGFVDSDQHSEVTEAVEGVINPVQVNLGSTSFIDDQLFLTITSPVAVAEGETAVINDAAISANDQNGSPMTFTLTTPPTRGTLWLDGVAMAANDTFLPSDLAANWLIYEHDGSETDSDSFDIAVTNGEETILGTVLLAITLQNDPPELILNTGVTVVEGSSVIINDSHLAAIDAESESLTFTIDLLPTNGTLLRNLAVLEQTDQFTPAELAANSIVYQHDGSETATDTIELRLSDGETAVSFDFELTIVAENDAPQLTIAEGLTVAEGETAVLPTTLLTATDPDSSPLTLLVRSLPQKGALVNNGAIVALNGQVSLTDFLAGKLRYAHDGSETVADSFGLSLTDGEVETAVQQIDITISPVNDAPQVVGKTAVIRTDEQLQVDLTLLTSDAENDTLTFQLTEQPQNGVVEIDAAGLLTYTPNAGFIGDDNFTFQANDGDKSSAPSSIAVEVELKQQIIFLPLIVQAP